MLNAPPDWQRAFTLLDTALALQPQARGPWLAQIGASEPTVIPLLRKLLAAHGRIEIHEFLATLPKLHLSATTADGGAVGMQVGPFALIAPLGRGGMGSVWHARYADGRLKRDVAIKLPASTSDPATLATLRERFARERDFLAQLQHPNIARLYDAGVSDAGQPYLAMEYVAGKCIDAHCDACGLPIKARLVLFLQVLDAVSHAHQHLVLHRDLKPSNVLVDAAGQARLLDFGVARLLPPLADNPQLQHDAAASDLTERAGAAFTLGYAAPEQLHQGALSTATDVYALGVMLYRLLTGLSPYQPDRDTRGALEDAVLLATPQAASSRSFLPLALQARQSTVAALRKTLRADLDVILGKALKKNPAERYPTVSALADDLRRHLAQQPISARPDSAWYRTMLFVARHRVAVAVSLVAITMLISATGLAIWQAGVSADNAARAAKEAARANTAQKFFAGLLSNADPEKNIDITPVDRQVVDQALATAESDFAGAPETLVIVLKQLGEIYIRLGIPAKVLQVQRKRVTVLESIPNATANDTVQARLDLGYALADSELATDRAQALAQLITARDMALKAHASDEMIVKALGMIADQYLEESNYQAAHAYAAQAVAHAQRTLPNPHAALSMAYEIKGLTATRLGDFDAAVEAIHQAMAVDRTGQGRGKVDQFNSRVNLANTAYLAGHYAAAKREALSAIEFARTQLGAMEGTMTPVRVRAVLASVRTGELDDAAKDAQQLLGPDLASTDAFRVARAEFVQGIVAMSRNDHTAALRAFAAAEPGLAADLRWQRSLAVQQAKLKLLLGQASAARDWLMPVVNSIRAETGNSNEEFSVAAETAGVIAARLGQAAQALHLFEESCAWRRATLKPNHPVKVRCECYIILIAENLSADQKRQGLQDQLNTLTAGRSDPVALVGFLRLALSWAGTPVIGKSHWQSFPLLD